MKKIASLLKQKESHDCGCEIHSSPPRTVFTVNPEDIKNPLSDSSLSDRETSVIAGESCFHISEADRKTETDGSGTSSDSAELLETESACFPKIISDFRADLSYLDTADNC